MKMEMVLFFVELTAFFITVVRLSNHLSVKLAKIEFNIENLKQDVEDLKKYN